MDKLGVGGGLSIDSDRHNHRHNFFSSTPFYKTRFMDSRGVDFSMGHEHDEEEDQKVMISEMDFFNRDVKKEDSNSISSSHHGAAPVPVRSKTSFNVNTGLNLHTSSEQSTVDDSGSVSIVDKRNKNELAVLQTELDRLNEENQRLKGMLNQVSNNYNALQVHLVTLMQQQNPSDKNKEENEVIEAKKGPEDGGEGLIVPRQFMDLGLAPRGETEENSHSSSEERTRSKSPVNNLDVVSNGSNNEVAQFDNRDVSPDHGSQGWVPNKAPKLNGSNLSNGSKTTTADQSAEATIRKARVSVRARSEAPMITDGCQWRKYGQKMAKGNPCPRAYYRCTMAAGCPVRKQVQRCAEDRTILVTTYEGNHNHPLPPAAMAMANTTSAAASVLLSGSMSSADGIMNSNYLTRTMLPCSSSMATISASAPFPTVTLDLTNSPNQMQLQRPPTQFHLPFLNPPQNFNSQTPQSQVFGQSLYNQSKFSGLQVSQNLNGNQAQFAHHAPPQPQQQQQASLADTVSAATAAITADPNFTAALAAAISSIIGGGNLDNLQDINNKQQ